MKKKFSLICAVAALLCVVTGCKKEYSIDAKTEAVGGGMEKAYELVKQSYPVTIGENGKEASITVRVKRTEVTLPFVADVTGVLSAPKDENMIAQAGFGYILYNADGEEMQSVKPEENKTSDKQQQMLLALKPRETGELTITFDFDENEVPSFVELTSDFVLHSTGDIALFGSIDKYIVKNFTIEFNFAEKKVSGQYQYTTSPAGAFLYLTGNAEQLVDETKGVYLWPITIIEDNGHGMTSGDFEGQLTLKRDADTEPYYYELTGLFTNYNFKTFRYNLKSSPLPEIYEK